MITRNLAQHLKKLATQYPVVAVTGPRQSGKTTLVKHVFQNKPYVNLEDIEKRMFAQKDPKGFLAQFPDGAILDEVQRVPDILSYIQVLVDEHQIPGEFIITGSHNLLLMEQIGQSLAGRVSLTTLLPPSIAELGTERLSAMSTSDIIFRGQYPKLYENQDIEAGHFYDNYIQTYIERDIRLVQQVKDLALFQTFVAHCAARVGQLLNISSLANDVGITHATCKSWLSLLEAGYVIVLLRPHHNNLGKRLGKMPKLYFYDTGLACSLLGINRAQDVDTHHLRGGLFESLIVSNYYKASFHQAERPELSFWRDHHGNEVDLLQTHEGSLLLIEIKAGATINQDYFKGLHYYQNLISNNPPDGIVVYGGSESQTTRSDFGVFSWRGLLG